MDSFCAFCGKDINVKKSKISKSGNNFCSRSHRSLFMNGGNEQFIKVKQK